MAIPWHHLCSRQIFALFGAEQQVRRNLEVANVESSDCQDGDSTGIWVPFTHPTPLFLVPPRLCLIGSRHPAAATPKISLVSPGLRVGTGNPPAEATRAHVRVSQLWLLPVHGWACHQGASVCNLGDGYRKRSQPFFRVRISVAPNECSGCTRYCP